MTEEQLLQGSWSQPQQLWSTASSVCSSTPFRWGGHLDVHRLSGVVASAKRSVTMTAFPEDRRGLVNPDW